MVIRHHLDGKGRIWLDIEVCQIKKVGDSGQSNLTGFLLKVVDARWT
jgi:hypothetical protein